MSGTLNIVTTPIGNYSDITLRALRVLNESEYVICEEYKEAGKLLRFFEIDKELKSLNEHNEDSSTNEIFNDILSGKNLSLISDGGTPVFSDPGSLLLDLCINAGIKIEFIGGANSVLAAIVISGFDISRFFHFGFLSPKSEIRVAELSRLRTIEKAFVLMDAPYRLKALLSDIEKVFADRRVFVGFNLTMKDEKQFRGTASEILSEIGDEKIKGEFVVVIDKLNCNLNQS